MLIKETRTNQIVYYDMSTKNRSFLNMHYFLKNRNITNNMFFLILYDPDLVGIDPFNPHLTTIQKAKVSQECRRNPWYFIRESVRIPDQGGKVGSGVRYELNRGNLALNWGFALNLNIFLELPRQFGKTMSALVYYLWIFLFGTTNSQIIFMNMKSDYSKENLQRLKDLREALPSYLKMTQPILDRETGRQIKAPDRAETIQNPINMNKVKAMPGARSRVSANGLGRGLTVPIQWYDEFAFILYNRIIRMAATPAFSTASKTAKLNHAPYGILLTTTPGKLNTDEAKYAFETKEKATEFNEGFYDYTPAKLAEVLNANTKSTFIYIKFTYKQLGRGEDYLQEMIKQLEGDYEAVRREVLLEWADTVDNCPFDQEDLKVIQRQVKEPIETIYLCGIYPMHIYEIINDAYYPPIVGVDVAGGIHKDSSAITVIDSKTTKVIACLNCNYISLTHLANCIYELVTKHIPTAVVNIERNGGFGLSVLEKLKETKIKKNLYYEFKDKVIEERMDGVHTTKTKAKIKEYGSSSNGVNRDLLMEILRERVRSHKDKFNSDILYNELKCMEIKKNGRIEHSENSHDDQVFSYLWALYVWYYGKDILQNWGIYKDNISTDANEVDEIIINNDYKDITGSINYDSDDPMDIQIEESINILMDSTKYKTYEQWILEEQQKKFDEDVNFLSTPYGRHAMTSYTGVDHENIKDPKMLYYEIPNEVFNMNEPVVTEKSDMQKMLDNIKVR